jgi:hypothetical protein
MAMIYYSAPYFLDCIDLDRQIPVYVSTLEIYPNATRSDLYKRLYFTVDTENFYRYDPIQLTINGERVSDITDYDGLSQPALNDIKIDTNKEFYYNFIDNKIYTNQNMAGVQKESIEIKFFVNINSVSVLNKMATNISTQSSFTPSIDYYIVKLNGQNFRSL